MQNTQLRIITWNANRNNLFDKSILEHLLDRRFDILFLQEINDLNLELIKDKFDGYHFYIAKEVLYSFTKRKEYYLVTLVKKDIISSLLFQESRKLKSVISPLYKMVSRSIDIEYSKIIILLHEKPVTLINCHLQYATSPKIRERQLLGILSNIDTEYFILSGDLNTFSKFPISILFGGLFGYDHQEYKVNESKLLLNNSHFNSGRNINTTIYFTGKLDWVLFSKSIEIREEYTLSRLGSDHYPLVVTCEF
ncbi:endonuclease/exonuclease/phosphatase family protein [Ursidibacter sp. B-7004-1]